MYYKRKEFFMATIIEGKRRVVKLSTDDVLNIIREYQQLVTNKSCCYEHTREILNKNPMFVPEDQKNACKKVIQKGLKKQTGHPELTRI